MAAVVAVMSARVSISQKSALLAFEYLPPESTLIPSHPLRKAIQELRAALAPKSKTSAKRKTEKRNRSKRKETSAIYEQVAKRAGGKCECGCEGEAAPSFATAQIQMDHFWGRGKTRQTVENCWMLSAFHHDLKSRNVPDAEAWLEAFRNHCRKHGYLAEAGKVTTRIVSRDFIARAESVGAP